MRNLKWMALAVLFLFASSAFAQTGSHTVALTWTASTDAAANPSLTYNVYRAPGVCSTTSVFASIATGVGQADTFTDTTLVPGAYCYQVTAFLNGAESVPSNQVTVRILPGAPATLVAVPK